MESGLGPSAGRGEWPGAVRRPWRAAWGGGGDGDGEGEGPIGHQGVHHFGGRSRNESTIMQAISSVSTLNGANVNVKIVVLNDNSGNLTF